MTTTRKNTCEMFLEYAYPLLLMADTDEEILKYADYAKTIWNYCIVSAGNFQTNDEYEKLYLEIRNHNFEFFEMCMFLESEKKKKFPDCHQIITDIGINKHANGERFFYVDTLEAELSE
ncbi:MAG TPA: hypothetical protein VFD91_17125 [Mariniphaga sp.]|nr:hypothetical protein [Mariniphaga sp.]